MSYHTVYKTILFESGQYCMIRALTLMTCLRELCCSSFVKDAAEDLMDQYGAPGGGEQGVRYNLASIPEN